MDDHELLQRYLGNRSQDSFQELVERHIGMVYAAARRMIGDIHLAEEVAQNVLTTLAHQAASVRPPEVIGG